MVWDLGSHVFWGGWWIAPRPTGQGWAPGRGDALCPFLFSASSPGCSLQPPGQCPCCLLPWYCPRASQAPEPLPAPPFPSFPASFLSSVFIFSLLLPSIPAPPTRFHFCLVPWALASPSMPGRLIHPPMVAGSAGLRVCPGPHSQRPAALTPSRCWCGWNGVLGVCTPSGEGSSVLEGDSCGTRPWTGGLHCLAELWILGGPGVARPSPPGDSGVPTGCHRAEPHSHQEADRPSPQPRGFWHRWGLYTLLTLRSLNG